MFVSASSWRTGLKTKLFNSSFAASTTIWAFVIAASVFSLANVCFSRTESLKDGYITPVTPPVSTSKECQLK